MSNVTAADLGYGDAAPSAADLGYKDEGNEVSMPSSVDLGYGEETLPSTLPARSSSRRGLRRTSRSSIGGISDPSSSNPKQAVPSTTDLGYGEDANPRDAARTTTCPRRRLRRNRDRSGTPTRASRSPMGGRRRGTPRRVTMDHNLNTNLCTPSHHTLAPRRSSLTASKSFDSLLVREKAPKTRPKYKKSVSFGGEEGSMICISHVPKWHDETEEDKKNVWYDKKELRRLQRRLIKIVRQEVPMDETEDCWRGLESYVKKHEASQSGEANVGLSDQERRNQIILRLQHEKRAQPLVDSSEESSSHTEEAETKEELLSSAETLLRKAMSYGTKQAEQDAEEAHAIYMETMDSEQVRSCFLTSSARGA